MLTNNDQPFLQRQNRTRTDKNVITESLTNGGWTVEYRDKCNDNEIQKNKIQTLSYKTVNIAVVITTVIIDFLKSQIKTEGWLYEQQIYIPWPVAEIAEVCNLACSNFFLGKRSEPRQKWRIGSRSRSVARYCQQTMFLEALKTKKKKNGKL